MVTKKVAQRRTRTESIFIRVTDAEHDLIVAAGRTQHLPLTTWCRQVLLREATARAAEGPAVKKTRGPS